MFLAYLFQIIVFLEDEKNVMSSFKVWKMKVGLNEKTPACYLVSPLTQFLNFWCIIVELFKTSSL